MHITKLLLTLSLWMILNNSSLGINTTTLEDDIIEKLQVHNSTIGLHRLSRKRRYLQFPEGSSFQMVYDVVMGVVDYSNYITISITMALAYELPSKPPSELLEDVKEQIKDGTFDFSRKDSTANIKYVDFQKEDKNQKTLHHNLWYPQTNSWNKYSASQPINGDGYYSPNLNPFHQYVVNSKQAGYIPQTLIYPQLNSGYRLNLPPTQKFYGNNGASNLPHRIRYLPINHRIYPILGKRINSAIYEHNRQRRSGIANDILSKYDRMHIRHQRNSRHHLYNSIEGYLDRKHINGHQCILRALCETSRKMEEQEPGSFIGELMRAIFTLPEPLEDHTRPGYKEESYDNAHTLKGNCANQYPKCSHSLWASDFVK